MSAECISARHADGTCARLTPRREGPSRNDAGSERAIPWSFRSATCSKQRRRDVQTSAGGQVLGHDRSPMTMTHTEAQPRCRNSQAIRDSTFSPGTPTLTSSAAQPRPAAPATRTSARFATTTLAIVMLYLQPFAALGLPWPQIFSVLLTCPTQLDVGSRDDLIAHHCVLATCHASRPTNAHFGNEFRLRNILK